MLVGGILCDLPQPPRLCADAAAERQIELLINSGYCMHAGMQPPFRRAAPPPAANPARPVYYDIS